MTADGTRDIRTTPTDTTPTQGDTAMTTTTAPATLTLTFTVTDHVALRGLAEQFGADFAADGTLSTDGVQQLVRDNVGVDDYAGYGVTLTGAVLRND